MHNDIQELRVDMLSANDTLRHHVGRLEAEIYDVSTRVSNTVFNEITELKCQFEAMLHNVNAVLLKLQECARREDLIDDTGGPLEEFIERFVVH